MSVTDEAEKKPHEPSKRKNPLRSKRWKFLRNKWFLTSVALLILFLVGSGKYKQLILQPPDDSWREATPEDLQSDRWYVTEDGRRLSEELEQITDNRAIKFITGLYYQEYKKRYSPGYKNTQLVKVGPDQYAPIWEMVVDACSALGAIDGDGIPSPTVYLGWTGGRGMEVTNFTSPSLVINTDFLWAFTPEELRFLIARQIGNIHCSHIYFLDVVKGARSLLNSALPDVLGRMILSGTGTKLLNWANQAHISADRAGLLVTGDVVVACQALIKLNILANPEAYYGHPNPEAFAAQAQLLIEDRVTTASAALAELRNPNPYLTTRVGDLLKFYEVNSALFKDRIETQRDELQFDPGVYEDEEATEDEGG
jgi:hypothetical protein